MKKYKTYRQSYCPFGKGESHQPFEKVNPNILQKRSASKWNLTFIFKEGHKILNLRKLNKIILFLLYVPKNNW